jgi:hypothetical protein
LLRRSRTVTVFTTTTVSPVRRWCGTLTPAVRAHADVFYESVTDRSPATHLNKAPSATYSPHPQALRRKSHRPHRPGPGDRHRPGQAARGPLPHRRRYGRRRKTSHHPFQSTDCRSADTFGPSESEQSKLADVARTSVDPTTARG